MKKLYFLILTCLMACQSQTSEITTKNELAGTYTGVFEVGNFKDEITFELVQDSTNWQVFFTSLAQNAFKIPVRNVTVNQDSISFRLQSDFYTYQFDNKIIDNQLKGTLKVDTVSVNYTLSKSTESDLEATPEEITFESNNLKINGTIWHPKTKNGKNLVILTSSQGNDRSASKAEAMLFAQRGFTTFHYDKRGTGASEGNWQSVTIEELASDDINAIQFFAEKMNIPLNQIGIKGSSQGATKVPYVLNELTDLKYGISVSCPASKLLESDLNFWKNRNAEKLGDNLESASELQGLVFRYIAGEVKRTDLEKVIENKKSESWFSEVWIPNLDEVQTDKKLSYSPMPHFSKVKQPILILQGSEDEIIPSNSAKLIQQTLDSIQHSNYKIINLDGASHSIMKVSKSDFPYWAKLHPDYLSTLENWMNQLP